MRNKWIFIIDTDSYAGNFERDMCAYITGMTCDCGVGEEFSKIYFDDTKDGDESRFSEYIDQRADDRGCYRPTRCWPTMGWLSDGTDVAIRKSEWDQAKANKNWQATQVKIYQGYYDMYAKYNITDPSVIRAGWTAESLKKQLDRSRKEIERVSKEKCPKYCPDNSVAIFFDKKPTSKMISLMKDRAGKFAEVKRKIGAHYEKNFKLVIHGFRLVKESTTESEEFV